MTLLLLVVTAGCGLFGPGDPREALAVAVAPVREGNYTFVSGMRGRSVQGTVHLPSRSAELYELGLPSNVRTMVVGDMRYTLVEAVAEDGLSIGWRSEDMTRYKPGQDGRLHGGEPDVTGVIELMDRVTEARWEGEKIVGKLNAWKPELKRFSGAFPGGFSQLDSVAQSLAFEVTLDDEGRLSRLTLDIPRVAEDPPDVWALQFADWGKAEALRAPPADQVTPAPDYEYDRVNGENGY